MDFAKRSFAMMLAAVMVFALAISAFADGSAHEHDITIATTEEGHIFEAYQIFSGNVVTNDNATPSEPKDDYKILSDVEWGADIPNGDELIAKLASPTVNPSYYTHYTSATTADDVANALSTPPHNTTAHAMEFATIAGEYIDSTPSGSANSVTPGVGYVIEDLADGYYMIKEKDGHNLGASTHTSYILELVSDVTVTLKGSEITVSKVIIDGASETTAADYSIGDTVKFKVVGTLPMNFIRFKDMEYKFNDFMAPGFTVDTSTIKVEFDNDGSIKELDSSLFTYTATSFSSDAEGAAYKDGTNLVVTISDLTKVSKTTGYTVNADTEIVLSYSATLNDKANLGSAGNLNKVRVEFDNDPYNVGTGKTEDVAVSAFTFGLNVTKKDGKTGGMLNGVKFKLYREHGGIPQYVVADANGIVTGYTETEANGTEFTTAGDNAGVPKGEFAVLGLEASVYTLKETHALDGYDTIEDSGFTMKGTLDTTNLTCTGLTITPDGQSAIDGNPTTGIVAIEVINNPGNTLPSTGGIGTTIFYIAGGIMVVVAAVLLITKKRMEI